MPVQNFPERPGALNHFLATVGSQWNISLFHYRGQGGNEGDVFIGFEAARPAPLERHLKAAGYGFAPVTSAVAGQFLGYKPPP